MHDFSTPNADEMYYNELARKVRFHKQDEKGVQISLCTFDIPPIYISNSLSPGLSQLYLLGRLEIL